MAVEYITTLFIAVSAALVWVSRRSLRSPRSHGFYRFFAWELILLLILLNIIYWFDDPFCPRQLASWLCLILSGVGATAGYVSLKSKGNLDETRDDPILFGIEKTTRLVITGAYQYIRHPMYSSLLFLTWGTALKQINVPVTSLAVLASVFLFFTARAEEKENLKFFGDVYREYMKRTRRFVPFLF